MPQEVNKVSLFKDPIYEDFGFSVSDGLYERGIYINRIRKGGPADESSLLKPFDRILQINQVERERERDREGFEKKIFFFLCRPGLLSLTAA